MRFFAVLALLATCVGAARARAQDEPPAPLDALDETPAAPSESTPTTPLAPETPTEPDAEPDRAAPTQAHTGADGACASWPAFVSGAWVEAISAGIGGVALVAGGLMASIDPTPTGGDCVQACVDALFALVVIMIGVSVAALGLLALGPLAAIGVTAATALASVGATRTPWPSVVGGSIGVVTSALGVGLLIWGFVDGTGAPFIGAAPFVASDPHHVAFVSGLALSATGGLVSLAGALALDAAFGGPAEEEPARGADRSTSGAPAAPRRGSVTARAMSY